MSGSAAYRGCLPGCLGRCTLAGIVIICVTGWSGNLMLLTGWSLLGSIPVSEIAMLEAVYPVPLMFHVSLTLRGCGGPEIIDFFAVRTVFSLPLPV